MANRLLITGGRGMVGRNLLDHITSDWVVAAPSRQELDLSDFTSTQQFIADFKPDAVVHAAGRVGGIQANMAAPVDFLLQNVDLGRNVILAAHEAGVERVLNLASSCIYPRDRDHALREEDILNGQLEPTNEGYAISKIFALRLCEYLNRQHSFQRFKTLIPCNLYGPYDHFEEGVSHLVPSIIKKVHQAKSFGFDTVDIWGDGEARREFMYAGDLSNVILKALLNFNSLPEVMNIGLGHDYSVHDYYKIASEVIGWSGKFTFDLDKPVGMRRKLVDISRQRNWGWQAKTSVYDGIASTYSYYIKGTH